MRPRSARTLAVLASAVAIVATGAGQAAADWTAGTPDETATYSTAFLTPATGLSATTQCHLLIASEVALGWTATTSTQATGYEVQRSTDGTTFTTVGTLSDRTATTYRDTTVELNTTYTYLVRAIRNSWYVDSTTATATTPAICP